MDEKESHPRKGGARVKKRPMIGRMSGNRLFPMIHTFTILKSSIFSLAFKGECEDHVETDVRIENPPPSSLVSHFLLLETKAESGILLS